jgi:hypothetical protein
MALEPRPDGYAEAKEELLIYCDENEITFPYNEFPYAWAEVSPQPHSPSPEITEIAPQFNLPQQERLDCTEESKIYDDNVTIFSKQDVLNTRKSEPLGLEMLLPLLPRKHGPDKLRPYGPESFKKCAHLLPKDFLAGENGMELSRDTSEVVNAFAKDSKLTVTEEDVDYLKSIISDYNQEKSLDLILSKVQHSPF